VMTLGHGLLLLRPATRTPEERLCLSDAEVNYC
jgi:hypothetical protein